MQLANKPNLGIENIHNVKEHIQEGQDEDQVQ